MLPGKDEHSNNPTPLWNLPFSPSLLHSTLTLPQAQKHSTQYNTVSDDELLHAYRRTGDNAWLGHLLQRYTVLLIGVAMKYLKDKDAAHDAVQQIFLKSLTHLPAGEIGNFKGWLYVLMRNQCLQQLRDKVHFAADEALHNIAADSDHIEALKQREITLTDMQEALKELSPDQRVCVDAFYLQRKSYHEIMAATGFSFAQVKSYIQNGKRNLKIVLMRHSKPHL
jgi:RNA polymerase sigma factor (sigma-70 family)